MPCPGLFLSHCTFVVLSVKAKPKCFAAGCSCLIVVLSVKAKPKCLAPGCSCLTVVLWMCCRLSQQSWQSAHSRFSLGGCVSLIMLVYVYREARVV